MSYNKLDFLNEEQDPKMVDKVCIRMNDLFLPDEELLYIAVQKKPAINLSPNSVVLTNKRLILFRSKSLGLLMDFEEYLWQNLFNFNMKETIFGADFVFKTVYGTEIKIDYLPRTQARKLYQLSQLQKKSEEAIINQENNPTDAVGVESTSVSDVIDEETIIPDMPLQTESQPEVEIANVFEEENRTFDVFEEEQLSTLIEEAQTIENDPPIMEDEIQSVESIEIITSNNTESQVFIHQKEEDPVATLQKLKYLLNNGLITQQDFDDKKAKILSRM